jgi:hypothetical protein
MIFRGKGREFNPFNLGNEPLDKSHRIRFQRLGSRIKTKSFWWLIAAFLFVIIIYLYIN